MRGVFFAALAGALAMATPVWAQGVSPAQIVAVINQERTANGIPPVTEDPALSAGCAAHDDYERLNGSPSSGYDIRGEDPTKPGYSAAGLQASANSVLAFGNRSSTDIFANDDFANGDVFDNAPEHLVSLMDPSVAVVGAAQIGFDLSPYGTIYISCVDVRSAPGRPPPSRLNVYAYIGPDGLAPPSVTYVEGPTANKLSGPVMFVYFLAPAHTTVTLRSLTLAGLDGVSVPLSTSLSGGLTDAALPASAAMLKVPSRSPGVGATPPPRFRCRSGGRTR